MEVCYRHPDRETGVACSNCGRPICPDCMTATPVGMRCPDCARQRTNVRTMSTVETPMLTYILIGINVAVALGGLLSGGGAAGGGFGGSQLLTDGAVSRPTIADGDYWRLITAGFLHSGIVHLAFNMLALYILGGMLEPALGRLRFGLIYCVALLAGSFGAVLLETTQPTVGASGAIFGLMGAAVVVSRRAGLSLMESGIGLWLGLNLLLTFTISNISVGGHLGGLVGGLLSGAVLVELPGRLHIPAAATTVLAAALGAAAVAGAIVVSS